MLLCSIVFKCNTMHGIVGGNDWFALFVIIIEDNNLS